MKANLRLFLSLFPLCAGAIAAETGNYVESFDTTYNSLTVERRGTVVELRARSRRGEALESAVDLSDPLALVVPYTRTLYAGLFFQPKPERVLMIGLGGAGFHRLFTAAYPAALLQTVERDPKVLELCETRLAFKPTDRTPVALMDGRMFVKRNKETWDWIILDAFRGGFVPPHLKTQEFYRECAARLAERGVFITNLHDGTKLFSADLKTLASVFPQIVLFGTGGRGNVIACAVKYKEPDITNSANWAPVDSLNPRFADRLNMTYIRDERMVWPTAQVEKAKLLTDDFSPVEFLNVVEENNKKNGS
jgi:spermidine synthase